MTPLLDQLRAKAKAATPGPWAVAQKSISSPWLVYEVKNGVGWLDGKASVVPQYGRVAWADGDGVATMRCGLGPTQNAEFIASANPETILKLCEAFDMMREALETCDAALVVMRVIREQAKGNQVLPEDVSTVAKKALNRAKEILG